MRQTMEVIKCDSCQEVIGKITQETGDEFAIYRGICWNQEGKAFDILGEPPLPMGSRLADLCPKCYLTKLGEHMKQIRERHNIGSLVAEG